MKIRTIRVAPLVGETPKGGWSQELKPDDAIHALVAVHTEDGVTGHGSVFTDAGLVERAVAFLEPLWRGETALEPERLSEKLHQNTFWTGRGGAITHAISGIDIALWDILGQVTGQPVGRLMGGRIRERVRPYASILMEDPPLMHDRCAELAAKGYRAIKIGWGPFGRRGDRRHDEAIVRAARSGAGEGVAICVDAGGSDAHWPNGLKWALETARMLGDHGVMWFEEALHPDALDDHIELRRQSPVPLAGGECLTRRQTFLPWIAKGALDIVQPDVTKVGGLSEQRRIAWLAQDFGVKYIGHGWNTALGLAADLQLASVFPSAELVEYIAGSPYVDDLTEGGFTLDSDGCLPIPATPGLGIRLDPDKVARLSPQAARMFDPDAA
ncbi:MAG: mandelate racemase/muconate lactonizing enzyme family protein [Rubellimicrobium sp.]|nr:mandelate racemase/muconate lactonizing enzyme family protein [Rubellimicrobium sp.]